MHPHQYKPLLPVEEADEGEISGLQERNSRRRVLWTWLLTFSLLLSVGVNLYVINTASAFNKAQYYGAYGELYSPAAEVVEYEVVKFNTGFDDDTTIYQGKPTKEIDQAWWELYGIGHTRITKEQARLLPNATSAIPGDEEHYIVELTVFHQLHCLDTLRRALHPDRYEHNHPLPNGQDDLFGKDHIDHCLDSIRQSIQCSSDITPNVWQWSPEKNKTLAKGAVVHSCKNFKKIQEWAQARQMSAPFNKMLHIEDDIEIVPF